MTGGAEAATSSPRALLRRLAGSLASGFGIALGRFPAAILAIAGLGILANLEVARSHLVDGIDAGQLAMALLVATSFSIAATLAAEARSAAAGFRIFAGGAAALAAGALVWFVQEPQLFAPPLLAASVLVIFLAPFAGRSDSLKCWTFSLWTFLGCLLGFASVVLFVASGSAIVEMVRYLFGIGPRPEIYKHVYATAFVFVGPIFALGRIPRDFTETVDEHHPDRLIIGLKILADWIAAPLILVAAVLLHAYAAKLVLTRSMPANEIGWLVSTYVVILLSQRILVEPFRTTGAFTTTLFRRFWAVLLLLPLLVLGAAIWLRIEAEGWTTERFFVALLCVAAGIVVAFQLVPKLRDDIRVIVAVFTVLLTLSALGPSSVSQMVARSQSGLIRQEFGDGGGLIRTANLTIGEESRLRSRIAALAEVGALPALAPMLPDGVSPLHVDDWVNATAVPRGSDREPANPASFRKRFEANAAFAFDVDSFDTIYSRVAEPGANVGPASAAIDGTVLRLRIGPVSDAVPLEELAGRLATAASTDDNAEPLSIDRTTASGRKVRLRILSATLEGTAIRAITFDAAVRRAEWSN